MSRRKETLIVELSVYVDADNYYHKGLSAKGIVEKELERIEESTGIYIDKFFPKESKKILDSLKSKKVNSNHVRGSKLCLWEGSKILLVL